MDTGTSLTCLGTAIGGAKILEKILGPTADYIGEQLKEWTVKKVTNISNIFKNAERKLGEKLEEEGGVPSKILKSILEDGAWCEEALQVEYFGGVLASSRTGITRDDRGAYFASLISRLSTYQLRTHYLLYHEIKKLYDGQSININESDKWIDLQTFISFHTFLNAMGFSDDEYCRWEIFLSHVLWGLSKEELITGFSWGNKDRIIKTFPQTHCGGVLFNPTKIGAELFMWAYGYGQFDVNDFFNPNIHFPNEHEVEIGKAISTKKVNYDKEI